MSRSKGIAAERTAGEAPRAALNPAKERNRAPRVSVIVPTRNRAAYLAESLASVARQTFADWECIVVDDGSTDETARVVDGFVRRDARFRSLRSHAGPSSTRARNLGLEAARGEYVTFLDDDDLFVADKLGWQVEALDSDRSAVLVYGETSQFRDDDPGKSILYLQGVERKPSGDAFESLLACSSIYSPLVRTATLRRLGGFDTSLPSAEDWDMWLSVARTGPIVFAPRVALHYRVHPGNKSAHALRHYRCAWRVARRHRRALPWRRRIASFFRTWRYLRRGHGPRLLRAARRLTASGDWHAARRHWRALAALDPWRLRNRFVLSNVAWSLLPIGLAPPWSRRPPAATAGSSS